MIFCNSYHCQQSSIQILSIHSYFSPLKLDTRAGSRSHVLPAAFLLALLTLLLSVFYHASARAQSGKPVLSVTATTSIAGPHPAVFTTTRPGRPRSAPPIPYNVAGT